MVANMTGLSRDLIIHPGETLKEILESRNMTQKELAVKTATTPQHISRVINGTTNISPSFAHKLEYVLNVDASFWINLQANYDLELSQFEEANNILPQELEIIKVLKKVLKLFEEFELLPPKLEDTEKVLYLRKIFGIANLTTIPRIQTQACYRTGKTKNIDVYVMFAWHKLCDYIASHHPTDHELDISLLKKSVGKIKSLMSNDDPKVFMPKLRNILNKCGVSFCVVPHITGAPVQGFIRELSNGSVNLCMTIRQKRADIFWFTLFHEIAHILNEDFEEQFTDFDTGMEVNDAEDLANEFARDTLIDPDSFEDFISDEDFSLDAIRTFAAYNKVPSYIVIGRLQKESLIPWSHHHAEIVSYTWK